MPFGKGRAADFVGCRSPKQAWFLAIREQIVDEAQRYSTSGVLLGTASETIEIWGVCGIKVVMSGKKVATL